VSASRLRRARAATRWGAAVVFLAGTWLASAATPRASDPNEQRANRFFESIRHQPPEEWAFLHDMPKGGDLHSHLSGAVYAESYVRWAVDAGLCLQAQTMALSAPPCDAKRGQAPLAAELTDGPRNLFRNLIDAWSMRNWALSGQSGHDHFFDSFSKFGAAGSGRFGAMLAEVASRAARGHVSYLEVMVTPEAAQQAASFVPADWHGDVETAIASLDQPRMAVAAARSIAALRAAENEKNRLLRCETPDADPGCDVVVRWIAQIPRSQPPASVLGQLMLAFHLASDPASGLVAVNLVQPEDGPDAMRYFAADVQIIHALRAHFPAAHVTLHAGELAAGLVPPEGLAFHIRDSVEIAGAERIGHGVDVMHETDAIGLLDEMAAKRVMVEICLTSNRLILGVAGRDHPLAMYLEHGVPVALATDDEGVSRSEMTAEFLAAAEEQQLGYGDLKAMARTSLEFAFLPGPSLWRDARRFLPVQECSNGSLGQPTPASACQRFLAGSEKARVQWNLERQFGAFEKRF
jgi:hypothetical protein